MTWEPEKVWSPKALDTGKSEALDKEQKGGYVIRYYSNLTWSILHSYHEGLVFQEVLIVLNDVWMVEQFQDLTLVLSCQALVSWHLLHWDLLQDDKGPVAAPAAEVNDPDRGGRCRKIRCTFSFKNNIGWWSVAVWIRCASVTERWCWFCFCKKQNFMWCAEIKICRVQHLYFSQKCTC